MLRVLVQNRPQATAAGIPIVVADVGPAREYFGDLAHHCNPACASGAVFIGMIRTETWRLAIGKHV